MSKGLEELEKIKTWFFTHNLEELCDLETIEKELREYEYWSSFVMCYGDIKAEDLQRFIHNGWVYDRTGYKKDKAFEIIKEKKVDMVRLSVAIERNDLSYYNYYCYEALTEEEYNLLKEVLKDD